MSNMVELKFSDPSISEASIGMNHYVNTGTSFAVPEMLAEDLLELQAVVNKKRCPVFVVVGASDSGGKAPEGNTAPGEENRSGGNTDVGNFEDSAENADTPKNIKKK